MNPTDDRRTPLAEPGHLGDERTTLCEFLDYYRTVFLRKVEDLDDTGARVKVAPSELDLLGMTRHLADVERWWFRAVFTAEVTSGNYDSDDDPDLDWHHGPADTLADALATWRHEVEHARRVVAGTSDLDTVSRRPSGSRGIVSLRWILVHMIEEYARHCGHADLLRQAVDGVTGD